MAVINVFVMLFGLVWGSFLNVIAYRLIFCHSLLYPRSQCPSCHYDIAWYDLIPVASWIILKASCRHCKARISWLYPCIELFTAFIMLALLFMVDPAWWPAYFIFFSMLIITIRTDLETMMISLWVSLYAIPLALLFSWLGLLPLLWQQSLIGSLSAYLFLSLFALSYKLYAKRDGIGLGDINLLAFIGAWTGIVGWWITLFIATLLGSLVGIIYLILYKKQTAQYKLPFGPFLSVGAILYCLFQTTITDFIYYSWLC